MLAPELERALGPDRQRYLGIVCLVARVKHSVSPYYALNITDRRIPLTSVVETTHVVDPEAAGGSLIYLPKYVNPDSPELEKSSADIRSEYLGHLKTMFPAFQRGGRHRRAGRARPRRRAGAPGRPRPSRTRSRSPAWSSRRRRRSTPTSCTGRRSSASPSGSRAGLEARLPAPQRRLEAA